VGKDAHWSADVIVRSFTSFSIISFHHWPCTYQLTWKGKKKLMWKIISL